MSVEVAGVYRVFSKERILMEERVYSESRLPSLALTNATASLPYTKSQAQMPSPLRIGREKLSSRPPSSRPSATAATRPAPRARTGKGIPGADLSPVAACAT